MKDLLLEGSRELGFLNTGEFMSNVEELEMFGMAPSETSTCCATGTCS